MRVKTVQRIVLTLFLIGWTLPVSIILRLMRYTVIALTIIATNPFREEIKNENIAF